MPTPSCAAGLGAARRRPASASAAACSQASCAVAAAWPGPAPARAAAAATRSCAAPRSRSSAGRVAGALGLDPVRLAIGRAHPVARNVVRSRSRSSARARSAASSSRRCVSRAPAPTNSARSLVHAAAGRPGAPAAVAVDPQVAPELSPEPDPASTPDRVRGRPGRLGPTAGTSTAASETAATGPAGPSTTSPSAVRVPSGNTQASSRPADCSAASMPARSACGTASAKSVSRHSGAPARPSRAAAVPTGRRRRLRVAPGLQVGDLARGRRASSLRQARLAACSAAARSPADAVERRREARRRPRPARAIRPSRLRAQSSARSASSSAPTSRATAVRPSRCSRTAVAVGATRRLHRARGRHCSCLGPGRRGVASARVERTRRSRSASERARCAASTRPRTCRDLLATAAQRPAGGVGVGRDAWGGRPAGPATAASRAAAASCRWASAAELLVPPRRGVGVRARPSGHVAAALSASPPAASARRSGLGGRARRLVQAVGVAHLRALPQRLLLALQAALPLRGRPPGAGRAARPRRVAAPSCSSASRSSRPACSKVELASRTARGVPPGGDLGVDAIVPEEVLRRPEGVVGLGDPGALLLQGAERLGDVGDHGLVQRGERLGQRRRERLLVGPLGQLRLAQLDQQVDQGGVPLLAEPEQRLVDRPPVGLLGGVDLAATRWT